MELTVLGCHGGSTPDLKPTSYLIHDRIAVDGGALTTGLNLEQQARIRHVFLSHAHIDHLATLPFLLDNLFAVIREPVTLYGPEHTIQCLKRHLFNDQLWPDVTAFSNDHTSIVRLEAIPPQKTLEREGMKITPVAMDHTVPCYGYLAEEGGTALFISGDTASLDGALPLIRGASGLEAILLEVSFPNRMKKIAALSRHLTPASFSRVVETLPPEIPILITHMKPDCLDEICGEVMGLGLDRVSFLEQGKRYNFSAP